jgi:hypothetical protein
MLPSILPGSRLRLAPRGASGFAAEVGDVVCFLDGSRRFVAHRVVAARGEDGARTLEVAGDWSGSRCAIDEAAVVGVVTRVEHPLLSYDARGGVGRLLARWALGRPASLQGAAIAAGIVARLHAKAVRVLRTVGNP